MCACALRVLRFSFSALFSLFCFSLDLGLHFPRLLTLLPIASHAACDRPHYYFRLARGLSVGLGSFASPSLLAFFLQGSSGVPV